MGSVISSFNYNVEASYVLDTKEYPIPDGFINSIIIDYNYDTKNMPGIYLALRLSTDLYNSMVSNSEEGCLSFRLYKYNTQVTNAIRTPYIQDKFIYLMSSDLNYNSDIETSASTSIDKGADSNSYMQGHIGLVSLNLLEQNRKLINDIVKNSNLISIVHKYTSHMNMCIETFENNEEIKQFIIPPINSITSLLSYLNSNFCFYKSGYRFFRDFSTAYLLSMKGNPVDTSTYEYNTIIIDIRDPLDEMSNSTAIEFDASNKAYIIYASANNLSVTTNRIAAKKYNNLIGVDTLGNINELPLDIPTYTGSTKKNIFERVPNDNIDLIYNTKQTLESGSVILSIVKNEIDTAILTPNKQYYIRSHKMSKKYDGKYVLSSKKEIFYRNTSSYVCTVSINLRKVED